MATKTIAVSFTGEELTIAQLFTYLKTISDARLPKGIFDADFYKTHKIISAGVVAASKLEELQAVVLDELEPEEQTRTAPANPVVR